MNYVLVNIPLLLIYYILITGSTDDTTIQNSNYVMSMEGSQDNILTTVDNITLQSDMKYSIQVSVSNLNGEFSNSSSTNISKQVIILLRVLLEIGRDTNIDYRKTLH